MKQTLSADIAAFVRKSETRLKEVVTSSIRDVVETAQTPVEKGGRMRVDTGFLRGSARAALDGFPSGRSQKNAAEVAATGKRTGQFDTYDGQAVESVLIDLKLGDTFYFGWVAGYAPTRELYDGFLATAVQNWQQFVTANSERFRDV